MAFLKEQGAIDPKDYSLLTLLDTPEEVVAALKGVS
jgi:predicted Rossmann-fold nucleotide-binding protein